MLKISLQIELYAEILLAKFLIKRPFTHIKEAFYSKFC